MTQDRRIDDRKPTEPLAWDTDRALTDAALQHLHDEKAAACLVEIPDTVPQLHVAIGTKDALRGLLREDPVADTEPLAGQVWTAPLGSAAAAQAAVPAELAKNSVLDLPGAIMNIPCRRADDTFLNQASRLLYKEGHRDARHDAADLVLARADELAALAAPAVPSPPLTEGLTDDLVALLKSVREWISSMSGEPGYGFYRPDNPHDFTPDAEACEPEEIAAHREACEAYDKGEYTPERGSEWVGAMHILRAPWGIGTYVTRDVYADNLIAGIDRHITRLSVPTSPPLHGAVGEADLHVECRECVDCGHAGINDAAGGKAACHQCDWNGPSPDIDECPGCGVGNCMGAACPKCGAIYKLVAESNIATPVATQSGAAAAPLKDAMRDAWQVLFDAGICPGLAPMSLADGIRAALKSVSAPDGGNDRKEKGDAD